MLVELNWIAVILAAISTMVVGSIWYGPAFGKLWKKLAKVKDHPDFNGSKATMLYLKAFLSSLLTAIVLAYAVTVLHNGSDSTYLVDAIFVAVVLWAGFTASRIFMHDLFESRPSKLTLLTVMHELVTIVVMAVIIGLLPA